jgi:urease alpha subunit
MDLEAIKSRLNAMQKTANGKGGGERASMFWKPTVGKQTVRVVPSKFNPTMPFSEIFFHYGIDLLLLKLDKFDSLFDEEESDDLPF